MGPFVDRFVITGHETRVMAASNKQADILFALNVYYQTTSLTMMKTKRHMKLQLKSTLGKMETNMDNEEGMHTLHYPMIKQRCIINCR